MTFVVFLMFTVRNIILIIQLLILKYFHILNIQKTKKLILYPMLRNSESDSRKFHTLSIIKNKIFKNKNLKIYI